MWAGCRLPLRRLLVSVTNGGVREAAIETPASDLKGGQAEQAGHDNKRNVGKSEVGYTIQAMNLCTVKSERTD